jgi:hypothetical protein
MIADTAIERWRETMRGSLTETSHRAGRVHRLNDCAIDYHSYQAQSRRLRIIGIRAARRRIRRLMARFVAWNNAPIRIRPLVINWAG